jgi:indolepyruvate ferredoxin oxidoreductase beta subunit
MKAMISSSKMKVQIILAGIGGQGILFSSKIFSELGLKMGLDIMGSETHGMSQRGGSVIAHLKLGKFQSPLIRKGNADILYSFEVNETYNTLKFLKPGGICFVNIERLDQFNKSILTFLNEKKITFRTYDANGAASKIGSVRSANIALIGHSVGTGLVPFKYEDLRYILELVSRKKNLKTNLMALKLGFREGKLLNK